LDSQGVRVPQLIKTNAGDDFIPFEHELLFIYKYIEGKTGSNSASFFPNLGQLIGRLHTVPAHLYPYQSLITPKNLLPIIRYHLEQLPMGKTKKELLEEIDQFPDFEQSPFSILHSHLDFSTVVEDQKEEVLFINLEQAGQGPSIIDLGFVFAFMLTSEQSPFSFDQNLAKTFLKGYNSIRTLSAEEIHLLSHATYFAVLSRIIDEENSSMDPQQLLRLDFLKKTLPEVFESISKN
jgi:Ser/Thr protein kinase RdoA (MazF antagonist)